MGEDQQFPVGNQGKIEISGYVSGQNLSFGHSSQVQVTRTITQNGQPTIDLEAPKNGLLELYSQMQNAGLPLESQMETQAAIVQAKKNAQEKEPQSEALARNIKQIGETLSERQRHFGAWIPARHHSPEGGHHSRTHRRWRGSRRCLLVRSPIALMEGVRQKPPHSRGTPVEKKPSSNEG
jgi:hypothetical protein